MDDVESEITVQAEHTKVHTKPKTILEVRRILLDHLKDIDSNYRVAANPIPDSAIEPVSVTFTDEAPAPVVSGFTLPPSIPEVQSVEENATEVQPAFDAGMLR